MSRQRKYAPSEREAEITWVILLGGVIAIIGAVLGVLTFGISRWRSKPPRDLLAPSSGTFIGLIKELGRTSLKGKIAFLMILGSYLCTVGILLLLVYAIVLAIFNPPLQPNDLFNPVLIPTAVLTALIPVLFAVGWFVGRNVPFLSDASDSSVQTLFHDGDVSLVNPEYQNSVYLIRVPRGMEWNSARSLRFVEQLLYSFTPLLFRISADHRSITWQVVDLHGRDPEMIENAIRISYPEADVRRCRIDELEPTTQVPLHRLTLVYRGANPFVFPLKSATEISDFDPLTSIVSAMNGLAEGERISTNLFVVGEVSDAQPYGERLLRRSTIKATDYLSINGFRTIAHLKSTGLDRVDRYVSRDQKVLEEKLRHPLYQALFMVQLDSPDRQRVLALAQNLDSQLYGIANNPYNSLSWYTGMPEGFLWRFVPRTPPDPETLITELTPTDSPLAESAIERIWDYATFEEAKAARQATRLILGAEELALLWHLPDEHFSASRIHWLSSRTVPPPTAVVHQEHSASVQLGFGTSGGKLFPIHLPLKDREKHVRIIGKTGVGKSSLLYDLIMQDIRQGYGVAVIDPHGSLVQSVLETRMSPEEFNRVVVLDLSDPTAPPPLNPLRGGLGHVRVGQIIQSIESIYPDTKRYPRTSYLLRAALLTLNADPAATLKDVVRLFTDADYREHLLQYVDDEELRNTWEEFNRMKESEKRTITEPIRNRMSPFYSNPDLTPIMCHPESLDFRALMRERKIILISLKMDEERVPETERDLIGALLLSRLQMSGMHEHGTIPYFVYIDEVQRFVTSSLDSMFAEARKFGLSLTVAHQYLDQLQDTTQNAIIGNAGASIIFACSPKDAHVFQTYTRPGFETDDIVNLDQFTAVVKMQCDGVSQPAFTLLTPFPQVETPEMLENIPMFRQRLELDPNLLSRQAFKSQRFRENHSEGVRTISRYDYTPMTRDAVIAWLRQRYGRTLKLDDQTQFFDTDE